MSSRNYKLFKILSLIRTAMSASEDQDFTRVPIRRALLLLAIPMMAEMAMESVFAVVDIFFVARIGPEAVAAVGLTEAMLTLMIAVAVGVAMATTAMVARRTGEHDPEGAGLATGQALWIGLAVSLALGVLGILEAPRLLGWMGADSQVIARGSGYTSVLFGGSITLMYLFLINAAFRGAGNAAIAMRVLWVANCCNIVLDPLLIFGIGPFPELGVTGAAVATTMGRGAGACMGLWLLFRGSPRLHLEWHHLRPVREVMWRLVRLSAGGVSQFLIATSSWMILMSIVARFGSEAVAGYTIAVRIILFTILPAWGLGNAAATLVGQHLGAGQPWRAERAAWTACRYNFYFLVAVAIVFIAAAPLLVTLFTDGPRVVAFGEQALQIIAYGYGFYAIGMILVQTLNGAGDTHAPMWINLGCYWLFQLPLAYGLAVTAGLGPEGVFWAVMVAESLLALVTVVVFRWGHWKLKVV